MNVLTSAPRSATVLRGLLVALGATTGFALVALPLVSVLHGPPTGGTGDFADLLVRASAAVALVSATWLWLCTVLVVLDAVRYGADRTRSGVPATLRRLVLVGCGVALAGSALTTPAQALAQAEAPSRASEPGHRTSESHLLEGLPLPERAVGAGPAAPRSPAVQVRPGDTLWGLAARHLPEAADPAAVSALWHRIYARNAAVIGPDPDLLLPGQRLHLPPPAQDHE